jgi:hypothetical protein
MALSLIALAAAAPSAGAVAPADFYGMTTAGQLTTDSEAAEMQRLGIHMVRLNIVWRDFQQSNCSDGGVTGMNFSTFDARVQRAAEHNLTVLGNFYGTRLPTKAECGNGADLHQFPVKGTQLYTDYTFAESGGFKGGFVWQVVQRYGQNGSFWAEHPGLPQHPIKIWEVWNEENLKGNNPGGESIQPQSYSKLLIDTSSTIKKAQEVLIGQNPYNIGTRVLLGGLWGDSQYSNGKTFDWPLEKYMKAIYNEPSGYTAAQAHAAFDGYSYHPYRLHGNDSNVEETISGTVPVRANLGDSGKSLWITEIGWQVAFGEGFGLPSYNAEQVGSMLNAVLSWTYNNQAYLNAQYVAPYDYQDASNPCTNEVGCWDEHSGIRDSSGKERPAWCAISNLINGPNSCGSGPAVVRDSKTGEQWVYFRGSNSAVWGVSWTGSGWTKPESLGGSMAPGSTPAVVRDATTGEQWLYYHGSDGAIWGMSWTGKSWTKPELIGGSLSLGSSPVVIRDASTGGQWLYYDGSESGIWGMSWAGSGWTKPELIGGSAAAGSSPTAVRDATTGERWVYYQGSESAIRGFAWTGKSWTTSQLLGGSAAPASSPAVIREPSGLQWLYYHGSDGAIWGMSWTGSSWTKPELIGGSVSAGSSPAVIRDPVTGEQWLYYQGSDGAIWGLSWTGKSWTSPQYLGRS